ncbi:MAG: hypothetical protein E7167_01235 [Firmicutes bacterium]|nr:hypothetical protein [Bacillota bacterium]
MYYTAPSFTNFEKVSEPYEKNKKMYVDVKHPNTGNVRSVRLYTEIEFRKAYGGSAGSASAEAPKRHLGAVDLKKARGFSAGPITLITTKDKEFLSKSNARYACDVGWYFVSTEEIPALPSDAKTKLMTWEEFNGKSKM